MAKFAKYYIRYKGTFGPYDWENRQKHLAALFEKDNSIDFGEGTPSEKQRQQNVAYAKTYNHRIYHLECNPSIIVIQLANSIDTPMEINYERAVVKNEPSCFVIIDNRDGVRTVAIQNRRKAFSAPKKVADILSKKISEVLYSHYCYQAEILPEYYPEDLMQAWNELERQTQTLRFCFPENMDPNDIQRNVEKLKEQDKPYFEDSLMQPLLETQKAIKESKYKNVYELSRKEKNGRIYVDLSSTLMKNLITFSRAANMPVELVTSDRTTFRCFVDLDEDKTDKIVHKELDSNLLEILFDRRKKQIEDKEIAKAESEIIQMLNSMKHTSEDIETKIMTA